jgi:hypothetical protein
MYRKGHGSPLPALPCAFLPLVRFKRYGRFVQIIRRRVGLLVLLGTEALAVVGVHGLGARAPFNLPLTDLEPWIRAAPADALAAALRVVALAAAWWLLAATALYVAACIVGRRGRGRVGRAVGGFSARVTPRAIRAAVDRAFATSLAVGALLVPLGTRAVAAEDRSPRVVVDVRDGRDRASIASLPTAPERASPPTPPPPSAPAEQTAGPETSPPPPPAASTDVSFVVVTPGDDLWSLSADALGRATGRASDTLRDDEIGRYWIAVCDANRSSLRSGDVNVVYPGEVVVLPPTREVS